mmetsp:Transcript_18747/g.3041  ORF Transcript_18747/g.3041 Transcript_18747/m.3041 type:complete len:97 (+) Transcript_18747:32-322(+)
MLIPKWFIRSRFWFVNQFMDEYLSREPIAVLLGVVILHIPFYFWGVHINREHEIHFAHMNYHTTFAPRRNRLAHSLIFEEFEMQVEQWREIAKEES